MDIEIRRVEKEELLGDLFEVYKKLAIEDYADMYPDEPPLSDKVIKSRLENKEYSHVRYFAFENGKMVGFMDTSRFDVEGSMYKQNKDRVGLDGFVLPSHRNKGLGTKLAQLALSDPFCADVEMFRTYSYSENGEKFALGLGGEVVEKSSNRVLNLSNVDWSLVKDWVNTEFEPERKPVVEFHKDLDLDTVKQFIDLSYSIKLEINAMDNRGIVVSRESEAEDWKESLSYWEAIGLKKECMVLKDSKGDAIGYTTCTFDPENPKKAGQGMTCVWKHLRGFGYGKLLKALMLENIRDNHPEVKTIMTSNNDLNDPMVGINHKLGFVEEGLFSRYVVDKAKALESLETRQAKWLK